MRADSRGFTLLETIAALTLLAMMAGFLVIAFRMASVSVTRGEDAAREMARLRAGIEIVERTIRSADPLPLLAGDKPAAYFRGGRDTLCFLCASPPEAFSGGGLRLTALSALGAGGLSLATASPFRVDGADAWGGTDGARTILPGARDVVFTYSAGPDAQGAWEWTETWDAAEQEGLPAAVRLEFTTASGSEGTQKTSLVVPVPAGG